MKETSKQVQITHLHSLCFNSSINSLIKLSLNSMFAFPDRKPENLII